MMVLSHIFCPKRKAEGVLFNQSLHHLEKKHANDAFAFHIAVGKAAGAIGTACNCLLCVIKLLLAAVTGSVSIAADGLNNLCDSVSAVVTYIGFHLAKRPPDEKHPFGYARMEYLSGLFVSMVITYIGCKTLGASIDKILHPQSLQFDRITIVLLVFSMFVMWFLARIYLVFGKRIQSKALFVVRQEASNDVFATLAVLTGVLVEKLFHLRADGYMGLIVAALILRTGITSFFEMCSLLLGKRAEPDLTTHLTDLILSQKEIHQMHSLLIHEYGSDRRYASAHVRVDKNMDSHIIEQIEREVLKKLRVHLVLQIENDA